MKASHFLPCVDAATLQWKVPRCKNKTSHVQVRYLYENIKKQMLIWEILLWHSINYTKIKTYRHKYQDIQSKANDSIIE